MRHDTVRPRLPGAPDRGRLKDLPLDKTVWQKAWQAFLDEDYKASLDLARGKPRQGVDEADVVADVDRGALARAILDALDARPADRVPEAQGRGRCGRCRYRLH